jgi:hypothetical protein
MEAHAVLDALLEAASNGWQIVDCEAQYRTVDGREVPASFQRLVISAR